MKGRTVAILESRVGEHLADLVRKRGATAIHAPALAEVPDIDTEAIRGLVTELGARPPRLAIFQTGVGTRALFTTTDTLGLTAQLLAVLEATQVAVRGPKPTGVLTSRRVRIDFSAHDPYTTAQLLEAIRTIDLRGARVLVQRFGDVNTELNEALTARGAEVIEVATYRWSLPKDVEPLRQLMDALVERRVDAVVFTSASQIFNWREVARRDGRERDLIDGLKKTFVASVGPVSSRALRELGVEPSFEASPPKLGPLLEGLAEALK